MVDRHLRRGFYLLSTTLLVQNVNTGRVRLLGNRQKAAKVKEMHPGKLVWEANQLLCPLQGHGKPCGHFL